MTVLPPYAPADVEFCAAWHSDPRNAWFAVGEQVVVVDGPFEGYTGGVLRHNPRVSDEVRVHVHGIHALSLAPEQLRPVE